MTIQTAAAEIIRLARDDTARFVEPGARGVRR